MTDKRISNYETIFLTRTDLSTEALDELKEKLKTIITQYDGEILKSEEWGKKALAYPIQKETRAYYTYIVYSGNDAVVAEIERNFRMLEYVLRFLTVKLDKETLKKQLSEPVREKSVASAITPATPTPAAAPATSATH
jgi:small subunit ribosomal protein S6